MGFAMLAILGGGALLYAGFKNLDPRSIIVSVFSGKPPTPLPGGTMQTLGKTVAGGVPPLTGGGTPPTGSRGATSQLQSIIGAISKLPGVTYGGVCVTSGHIENSEHYHCNAVDIFASELILDALFVALLGAAKSHTLPIHCLIYERYIYSRESNFKKRVYQVPSGGSTHDDHIHASGWPSVGGGC